MDWMFYPLIGGIVLLVGLFLLWNHLSEKKRTREFERLAGDLRMRFELDALEIQPLLTQFELFCRGSWRKASRLLVGGEGEDEICVFDYRFTIPRGKNSQTYWQTVAAFRTLPTDLPDFQLRPEHMFHKIGEAFGYQDIDIDEHREFSKKYLLRGPQEYGIKKVFTPALVDAIMQLRPLSIEVSGAALVLYRHGRRVKPAAIGDFLDEARDIQAALLNKKRSGVRYRLT